MKGMVRFSSYKELRIECKKLLTENGLLKSILDDAIRSEQDRAYHWDRPDCPEYPFPEWYQRAFADTRTST